MCKGTFRDAFDFTCSFQCAWNRLAPLADWIEKGVAPDDIVARHFTNGRQDNERKVCAYPRRAAYAGPAGGENNPANWIAQNFTCR